MRKDINRYEELLNKVFDYIKDKIEVDKNDLTMITNPLQYIRKIGAIDTLYDLLKIIDSGMEDIHNEKAHPIQYKAIKCEPCDDVEEDYEDYYR